MEGEEWFVVGEARLLVGFYFYKTISIEKIGEVEDLLNSDVRGSIEDAFGKETCIDSDDGKNNSIKGSTISYRTDPESQREEYLDYSFGSFTKVFDHCTRSGDDGTPVVSSKYLVEGWCDGDHKVSSVLECENICENGICVPLEV